MHALIVKTSALGDIVHGFPVAAALHSKGWRIDWVVEHSSASLVERHPFIETVHKVDSRGLQRGLLSKKAWGDFFSFISKLRTKRYDLILDLQGNCKSGLWTLLAKGDQKVGFGRKSVFEWPNMLATHTRYDPPKGQNVRSECLYLLEQALGESFNQSIEAPISLNLDENERQKLLALGDLKETILVSPGSRWDNKNLDPSTLGKALYLLHKKLNIPFLISYGSPTEKKMAETLLTEIGPAASLLDPVSLPLLQHIMVNSRLVIGMDSLPLHLAGAGGAATFSFFGSSSQNKYQPQGPLHKSLQGSCPYGEKFERRCRLLRTCKTGACMKSVGAEVILEALLQHPRLGGSAP